MSKKLIKMKEFLEEREGWSLEEFKTDLISKTNLLNVETSLYKVVDIASDECCIVWGEEEVICELDEFVDKYTDLFIKSMCNLIDSYIKEGD